MKEQRESSFSTFATLVYTLDTKDFSTIVTTRRKGQATNSKFQANNVKFCNL